MNDKLILILSKFGSLFFILYYFILSLPVFSLLDKLFYSVKADYPDRNKLPNIAPWKHDFLHLKKPNGTTILIHYVTHENSDNTKPLLLFVHGFPENWYSWRHQMKRFAEDYHVVAIDMRGYNHSSKPSNRSDYSMEALTEDLRQVITILYHAKADVKELEQAICTLVAHDWGGAVAWNFVTKYQKHYPEYVEKYIVMNIPNPKLMLKNLQTNAAQVRRSWYIYFFQIPFLPERWLLRDNGKVLHEVFTKQLVHKENINESDVSEFQNAALIKGAITGMINYYRNVFTLKSLIGQLKNSKRGNQKIPVKTLIIWGEQDVALGKELTYGTDRYVDDVTIKYIPDASHWVQQDTPKLVNEYMAEFLQSD